MRTFFILLALCIFILVSYGQVPTSERVPGELIVQLSPKSTTQDLNRLMDEFSGFDLQLKQILSKDMHIWHLHFNEMPGAAEKLLANLRVHPAVEVAQYNHLVTNRR
ncbi:hypothetical protein MASR1M74_14200 [Lentimicrobium sp.]